MTYETLSKKNLNDKILLIGNGYIGNHLFKHFKSLNCEVHKVGSSDLNYHDPKNLRKFILNENIDVVINCSGFTGKPNIDEAEIKKELCWELNVMSPLRVNQLCNELGINYIHVSSGCVYDGYEKSWTEEDKPNYGLFENHSSFYSKTKHSFEILSEKLKGRILRIRMPFGPDHSYRNYLQKIAKYDNLIDYRNSKTYIPDFCNFVSTLIQKEPKIWTDRQIYNVVNPQPLTTMEVCNIMKEYNFHNVNWKFVPIRDLEIATGRSNCTLNSNKALAIYPLISEQEALEQSLRR